MWPCLITRLVIGDLLKVFLTTLAVLTLLMLLLGLAQEAIRQGLGPLPILRLVPYVLPNALVFAIPSTILFAACNVFGRMSGANELLAIQAVGVPPKIATRPAYVLAFILSLVSVWLIDVAFSWGYAGVQFVVLDSLDEIAYGTLRTQHCFSSQQLSISVTGVEGPRLIQPTITIHQANGETVNMYAREAELHSEAAQGVLLVSLTDSLIEFGRRGSIRLPNTVEQAVPLAQVSVPLHDANPSHMRLRDVPAATRQQRERISQLELVAAADAAYQLMTGDFVGLSSGEWGNRLATLDWSRRRLYRLEVEPYRRWASGFTCLAFVSIGIPLAIRLKNSDVATTFGACFLPILVVYYPLFAAGLDRAKNGVLPPVVVWFANGVCVLLGLWLGRRQGRG